MNHNTDKWISLADQQPGDDEFPVTWGMWLGKRWNTTTTGFAITGYTHWISHHLPPPPDKEKTQAELDVDAWSKWIYETSQCPTTLEAWNAAIAYERADISKMLKSPIMPNDFYEQLRKRVTRVTGGTK